MKTCELQNSFSFGTTFLGYLCNLLTSSISNFIGHFALAGDVLLEPQMLKRIIGA